MAGLWKVPDRDTQMLMQRFYENLWKKRMSKIEALREAQLWMLREAPKRLGFFEGTRHRGGQLTDDQKCVAPSLLLGRLCPFR